MSVSDLSLSRSSPRTGPAEAALSVIIPTFNRVGTIEACLDCLFAQNVSSGGMEILVIDDGSEDGTSAALSAVVCPDPHRLVVITQRNRGANAARNRGLQEATAPLVAFLNDDSLPQPGWAAEHLRMHLDHPGTEVAVLGSMRDCPTVAPSLFGDLHRNPALDRLPTGAPLDWHWFYTYNISVKRGFIGGRRFHEALRWHEDIEFGRRLHASGLRIVYAGQALVLHRHPMTEADYFRIAQREGEALATWFLAAPELRQDLVALGLRSGRLGTRAWRHRLADTLIRSSTYSAWLGLARRAAKVQSRVGKICYQKLYQWHLRRSIDKVIYRHSEAALVHMESA